MHRIRIFIMILTFFNFGFTFPQGKNTLLVCYGKFDFNASKNFEKIILETKHFNKSEIFNLQKNNSKIYGYISLGEVNKNADHYKLLENDLLGKNENWDSYYLNLKSIKTKMVLIEIIQQMVNKGVDGIFLDNIDNFSKFGPQNDQNKELERLISLIKNKFPKLLLIQNSGVELLSITNEYVDEVLFESIFTNYDFEQKKYQMRVGEDLKNHLQKLQIVEKYPKIKVLLIEYADTLEMYQKINNILKNYSHNYFIGTIDLQRIPSFSNAMIKQN